MEACRRGIVPAASFGFSDASFYTWRAKFTSKAPDRCAIAMVTGLHFLLWLYQRAIPDTFFDCLLAH
jgi:hypothetical protein